jgi:predicted HNH restriction endonuclease
MIRTIKDKEELRSNLSTVEHYLTDGTDDESDFVNSLIKKGNCFVAYKMNNEWRFAPSRFVGYQNNSMKVHLNNKNKDGRETNPVIDKVIGSKLEQLDFFESEYLKYCKSLGIDPDNRKRKYWQIDFGENDFTDNSKLDDEFPEGKIVERKHKARERNRDLVVLAKNIFKEKNGRLFCEACGFDFEENYGELGKDFIEAHHTKPVSEMSFNAKTRVEDLIMVCSNCHKMIHRKRPWLNMQEIKGLIKKV